MARAVVKVVKAADRSRGRADRVVAKAAAKVDRVVVKAADRSQGRVDRAVVKAADHRTLLEIGAEVTRLAQGATARKLGPADLSGQTFTISNIGALGGGFGTPLVPPGTTAILSVGKAAEQPVAVDGKVVIAPLLPLSLSYDHRVVDGGLGQPGVDEAVSSLVGFDVGRAVVGVVLGDESVLGEDGSVVESIADAEPVAVLFYPSHG